jgi:hypothetical protein
MIMNSSSKSIDFMQTSTNKEFTTNADINNPKVYQSSCTNTSHHYKDSQHTNISDDYHENLMKTPPRSQNCIKTNTAQRFIANSTIATPLKFENNLKHVHHQEYNNNMNKGSSLICTVDSPYHVVNECEKYNEHVNVQTSNPNISIGNYKKCQIDEPINSAVKFSINTYKSIPHKSFTNLQRETSPKQATKMNKNPYQNKPTNSQINSFVKFEMKPNTCMPQNKKLDSYTTLGDTYMDFSHTHMAESYQSNPIDILPSNNNTQYNKTNFFDIDRSISSGANLSETRNTDVNPNVQVIKRQNPYHELPRAQTQLWYTNTTPSEKMVNKDISRRTTLCEGHLNKITPVHLPRMVLGHEKTKETEFRETLLPKPLRYHT